MRHEGERMADYNSVLNLKKLVFDKIEFDRKGFKNEEKLKFELQAQIELDEDGTYKVTLVLNGTKKDEYNIVISVSGFFRVEGQVEDQTANNLITKNAVAILMPYLRSELTLLTAQPNTESVVLPPFNINRMFEK